MNLMLQLGLLQLEHQNIPVSKHCRDLQQQCPPPLRNQLMNLMLQQGWAIYSWNIKIYWLVYIVETLRDRCLPSDRNQPMNLMLQQGRAIYSWNIKIYWLVYIVETLRDRCLPSDRNQPMNLMLQLGHLQLQDQNIPVSKHCRDRCSP